MNVSFSINHAISGDNTLVGLRIIDLLGLENSSWCTSWCMSWAFGIVKSSIASSVSEHRLSSLSSIACILSSCFLPLASHISSLVLTVIESLSSCCLVEVQLSQPLTDCTGSGGGSVGGAASTGTGLELTLDSNSSNLSCIPFNLLSDGVPQVSNVCIRPSSLLTLSLSALLACTNASVEHEKARTEEDAERVSRKRVRGKYGMLASTNVQDTKQSC